MTTKNIKGDSEKDWTCTGECREEAIRKKGILYIWKYFLHKPKGNYKNSTNKNLRQVTPKKGSTGKKKKS